MELSFEAGSWWSYVVVFAAGATPVLEVLVVIPAGILAGMPAAPTALVAVAGNLSTVALVALAGDRLLGWWCRRRPRPEPEPGSGVAAEPSRRSQRARELAQTWGVPGLAFLAPITTGTHIATVAALATGAARQRVLRWMAVGIAAWSAAVAVAAAAGLDLFR